MNKIMASLILIFGGLAIVLISVWKVTIAGENDVSTTKPSTAFVEINLDSKKLEIYPGYPKNLTASVGGTVWFECPLDYTEYNLDDCLIEWRRITRTSNINEPLTVTKMAWSNSYAVQNVSLDDEGWYFCIIFNDLETAVGKAYLRVTETPSKTINIIDYVRKPPEVNQNHSTRHYSLTEFTLIADGINATEGQFPFVVSLKRDGVHVCGGAILDQQWILTAAHCIHDSSISSIQYGSITLNAKNGREVGVAQTVVHPLFKIDWTNDTKSLGHDIGLLKVVNEWQFSQPYPVSLFKLQSPLKFGPNVAPVTLPAGLQVPFNDTADLVGWGYTDLFKNTTETLQYVPMTIFTREFCKSYFPRHYNPADQLCAGNLERASKSMCDGDSGSPLVIDCVVWGVASWSLGQCTSRPGVYVNVLRHRDWIKYITGI